MFSTFGADQGWHCKECGASPTELEEAFLYVEAAEKDLYAANERVKRLMAGGPW